MASKGQFRFLKDHFVGGEYIFAGEIREMFDPWLPTADVEPLNDAAVTSFYAQGPRLGAVIRTQYTTAYIYKPITYWKNVGTHLWALTGLGASLEPVVAIIGRIEDKSI